MRLVIKISIGRSVSGVIHSLRQDRSEELYAKVSLSIKTINRTFVTYIIKC